LFTIIVTKDSQYNYFTPIFSDKAKAVFAIPQLKKTVFHFVKYQYENWNN